MADSKLTALTALTGAGLAASDVFEVTDISDTSMDASGTSKKMQADELAKGLGPLVALTTSSHFITSDVVMTTAGTYYDGPGFTAANGNRLPAGTYLLIGHALVTAVTNAVRLFQGKLWDSTTVYANDALQVPGTAAAGQGPLLFFAFVTTAGSTDYKISCTSSVNSDHIAHNAQKGSYLLAIKIG